MSGSPDYYRHSSFGLKPFRNLRVFALDIFDLLLDAASKRSYDAISRDEDNYTEVADSHLCALFRKALPETVETLVLRSERPVSQHDADDIDLALVAMIKSDRYARLRAIFVEDLEKCQWAYKDSTRSNLWFRKAIKAGIESGVYIHSRTSQSKRKREFDFPMPYCEWDLVTSPYTGVSAPEKLLLTLDWVGVRVVGHVCLENCGYCIDCSQFYDEDVWCQRRENVAVQGEPKTWARSSRGLVLPYYGSCGS